MLTKTQILWIANVSIQTFIYIVSAYCASFFNLLFIWFPCNKLVLVLGNMGRHGILILTCLLFVLFEKISSIKSCHFSNHGILIEKTKPDGFLIFSIAQCTMAIMSSFFRKFLECKAYHH